MSVTTAFDPKVHGFNFANSFSAEEIMDELLSAPSWLVPDDTWGLCGGMCFAALDRYFRGEAVPETTSAPGKGDPLFSELVSRQMDSVDSVGVTKILDYQARPDEGAWYEFQHSLGYYTQANQWPSVKAKLVAGIPTTICLIRAGRLLGNIGKNHQVVVWGYTYDSDSHELVLKVYDPNYPNNNDVRVGLTLGQEDSRLDAYQEPGRKDPRGFLRVPYDRKEILLHYGAALTGRREVIILSELGFGRML